MLHRRAVTLIEMLVVVFVVLVILTMGAWAIVTMTRNVHFVQGVNATSGIVSVAQLKARVTGGPFGLFFYVNSHTNKQVVVHIKPMIYPFDGAIQSPDDTAQRWETVGNFLHEYKDGLRIAPLDILEEWEDHNLENENYRDIQPPIDDIDYVSGRSHRNFFALIFHPRHGGADPVGDPVVVYDPDLNDDGEGDRTGLVVADADACCGGTLIDVVISEVGDRIEFGRARNLMIYDDNAFSSIPNIEDKKIFLQNDFVALLISRYGKILRVTPK